LLRNDLGTLVDRYRRFCIVAQAATDARLLLPDPADLEQQLPGGAMTPAAQLVVRKAGARDGAQVLGDGFRF
jgi:hypothetical protein